MILKKFLADPMIPKPKSCLFTSWYSQPYTGGSYTAIGSGGTQVRFLIFFFCSSNFSLGNRNHHHYHHYHHYGCDQADVEMIAAPLYSRGKQRQPVVSFAGEHCHPSFYRWQLVLWFCAQKLILTVDVVGPVDVILGGIVGFDFFLILSTGHGAYLTGRSAAQLMIRLATIYFIVIIVDHHSHQNHHNHRLHCDLYLFIIVF